MATPRQPRRPITRRVAASAASTRGSLALSDPVIAANPYATGAQIYPQNMRSNAMTDKELLLRNPNPPIDPISRTDPPLKNYGATGTSFLGGIIQSDEYNPEFGWRDAVIKYEQMSRNEAQIMAIKQQYEMPILAAKWSIEPASDDPVDKEIASFVQSCLFDDMCYTSSDGTEVYQSWNETLRQILMFKWYGFMLLEKCFRIDDGWVKWSRWLPLLPRTVWRWHVGPDNELEAIEQWAYKQWTYQFNEIPRGKLIHFANRMEGQNYQGVSVLRSAFKNWWYKQQFEKIAAIEIERNSIIPPVIQMGPNPSADEVNAALRLAQNIRANEQLGVVIGHDMHFEYPRMTERGAAQILPLIEYHDNMIARNILGQFINLGSHEVGSYALAQQQVTNFLNTLQGDCQYVCDIINHQAIRQLVDYNFDGVAVYPKLTVSRLVSQDITTLSTALQYLNTYVPPSPEVNDAIADALGLPKPPQSMVEATNPSSPTTPDRPDNAHADDHTTNPGEQVRGNVAGTGGGRDGSADYQDTYDNGGAGDGVGMSEMSESASEALREFRLLRESLDAFHAQLDGDDAVERGLTYLFAGGSGGNPNHIPKGEPGAGQFAPGGNGGHGGSGEHEGAGRGRGGSGGAGGSEHEGRSRSSSGSRSSGSKAKAENAEKPAKIRDAELNRAKSMRQLTALQQEVQERMTRREEHHARLINSTNRGTPEAIAYTQHSHDTSMAHDRALLEHISQRQAKMHADAQKHGAVASVEQTKSMGNGRRWHTVEVLHPDGTTTRHSVDANKFSTAEAKHEAIRAAGLELHAATTTHAPKSSTRSTTSGKGKAAGERTLEQHTHDELKAMAREQGVRSGKTKAETIANIRAKGLEGKSAEATAKGGGKKTGLERALTPLEPIGAGRMLARGNAAMAPNAHYLRGLYGDHQLATALGRSSHEQLRLTAEGVGIKAGRSKADTISRIVKKVQEVPYEQSVKIGNAAVSGMQV